MSYFVAVDGGGSKTIAAIFSKEINLVSFSRTTSSNPNEIGFESAARVVYSAISEALTKARLPFSKCSWYSVALAGIGREKEKLVFLNSLTELLGETKIVSATTDIYASYISVFTDKIGILLTVGTGSAAISFNEKGEEIRSGGWGASLDDEGSGYWIGLQALRAVMQSYDGRLPKTKLYDSVLSWLSLSDPLELISWINNVKKDKIAAIAPIVISLAEQNDPIAQKIVENAATELAKMVWGVWNRLGSSQKYSVKLAFAGGLSQNSFFKAAIVEKLREIEINFTLEEAVPHPLIGAAMVALENLGVSLDEEKLNKLRQIVTNVILL
jgi:N-acetylglucosamine kinase-like BadF-type ATPase